MKISDFVKGRDVKETTVRMFISRNAEQFDGHITKVKKWLELDEVAVDILSNQYPIKPDPVVVNGIPKEEHMNLLEEYNIALKEIAKLQTMAAEQARKIAGAEAKELLLEEKERQLEEKQSQMDTQAKMLTAARKEIKEKNAQIDALNNRKYELDLETIELQRQVEQLQADLERESSKTWWDKLRKK